MDYVEEGRGRGGSEETSEGEEEDGSDGVVLSVEVCK